MPNLNLIVHNITIRWHKFPGIWLSVFRVAFEYTGDLHVASRTWSLLMAAKWSMMMFNHYQTRNPHAIPTRNPHAIPSLSHSSGMGADLSRQRFGADATNLGRGQVRDLPGPRSNYISQVDHGFANSYVQCKVFLVLWRLWMSWLWTMISRQV